MRNRAQAVIGIVIILFGMLLLVGNILDVNVGVLFWPLLLIAAGLWLVLRPRMVAEGTAVTQKILGDIERSGQWTVHSEDITLLIGSLDLDLREANIPVGDTNLRFIGIVGDIDLSLPEDVGIFVVATAVVSEIDVRRDKQETIFSSGRIKSSNYATAERRIQLHATFVAGDIKAR